MTYNRRRVREKAALKRQEEREQVRYKEKVIKKA